MKMTKKRKIIIFIFSILFLILFLGYFALIRGFYAASDRVTGEYNGRASIQEFNKYDDLKIGANKYNQPIFVDYRQAMKFVKKEYSDVLDKAYELYHKEYKLGKLNNDNFGIYMNLIHDMPSENEEQRKRNVFVAGFFDIYENSLKRWIYIPGMGWDRVCP